MDVCLHVCVCVDMAAVVSKRAFKLQLASANDKFSLKMKKWMRNETQVFPTGRKSALGTFLKNILGYKNSKVKFFWTTKLRPSPLTAFVISLALISQYCPRTRQQWEKFHGKQNISAREKSRREKKSEPSFEPRAAGWEAQTLPLCYIPLKLKFNLKKIIHTLSQGLTPTFTILTNTLMYFYIYWSQA